MIYIHDIVIIGFRLVKMMCRDVREILERCRGVGCNEIKKFATRLKETYRTST